VLDLSVKNKFQLIVLLILGVALAGGVYLSQRSQETRRGAAGGEKVILFMPDERNLKVGEVLETTIVVGTEPGYGLSAATLNIKYNPQVVDFQTADALSYFGIFSETGVSGDKNFDLVYKPGGATFGPVSLVKLRFLAKVAGAVDLNVGGNIDLLDAENNTLSAVGRKHKIVFLTSEMVAKPNYVVEGNPVVIPSGTVCKEGVNTLKMDENYSCDSGGGYRYANCECYDGFGARIGSEDGCYNYGEMAELARKECVGRSNCSTIPIPGSDVSLSLSLLGNEPAVVGKPFKIGVDFNSIDSKVRVSGLKLKFNYNTDYVSDAKWRPGIFSQVGSTDTDIQSLVGGELDLNLVSMKQGDELLSSGRVAEIELMPTFPKVMDGATFNVYLDVVEVVGVDINGKSKSFGVKERTISLPVSVVLRKPTITDMCRFCPEGERILGDANCDNSVSMLDFEVWRSAKHDLTPISIMAMANLDCSSDGVMMADFEVWRKAMFDK
jgi:hypothetical protein